MDMNSAHSWLELSKARLLHNLAGVRALAASGETDRRIIAVVKANAYGAGAVGMAQTLAADDVDAFAVATVSEGVELREAGIGGDTLCLTYFAPAEVEAICAHNLTPAVFTLDAARGLSEGARKQGRRLNVWVKVDTGLSRLGVPYADAADCVRQIAAQPALQVAGLFSTLAENPQRDPIQVSRLLAVREQLGGLSGLALSIASSHAIVSLPASYLDAVRPGIMLHGLEPSERERLDIALLQRADLQPIATWKTRVGYMKVVPPGEQVGYGVRPALTRETPLATLTVGWADGYQPLMSNGGEVLIHGQRCPVLAVSANTTLADAARAPDAAIGDEAILLGRQGAEEITAAELARATGSVYRLLTSIPRETPRRWV